LTTRFQCSAACAATAYSLVDRYLSGLEAELGGGRPGHPVAVGGRVRGGGVGTTGPSETSLLEVVLFVLPFVLPIAAAIDLAIRLRTITGNVEQRPAELH
jgi:hypothetical protein